MALNDLTVEDLIRKHSISYGSKTAFRSEGRTCTFAEYADDSGRLAAGLASLGLAKGDRIAVTALNSYDYFVLYGAAAFLGAIVVAVNWRLKPDEIAVILEDSDPKLIVASPECVSALPEIPASIPAGNRLVMGGEAEGFLPLASILNDGPLPATELNRDDPFVIIHTAAVEGRPRGAVLTQGNIFSAGVIAMIPMGLDDSTVHLNLMPLFHIMGLQLAMTTFSAGGCNIITEKFDADQAAELIEKERVTLIGTVPPMLARILDSGEANGRDLTSLRVVSGLFDHPDTIARCKNIAGAQFWVAFGQTETTGFITLAPYEDCPGSSGKEGHMVRMRMVDDYDRDVEPGKPGEIVVRGPVLFKEYWNLKAETEYAFRSGWHHTGDLGRIDENGYLWYVGRKAEKELIKPGGENVYPVEVEKVLLSHDDVLEACVFGVPDKDWGEAIKAVCALKSGSKLTPKELIAYVGKHIAGYKKPKHVVFTDSLPKTQDGGIDRPKVKEEHKQ